MPKHHSSTLIPKPGYIPYGPAMPSGPGNPIKLDGPQLSSDKPPCNQQSLRPKISSIASELHPIVISLPPRSRRPALVDIPRTRRARVDSPCWPGRPDGSVNRSIRRMLQLIKGKDTPPSNPEQARVSIRDESSLSRPDIHYIPSKENRFEREPDAELVTVDVDDAPRVQRVPSASNTSNVPQWIRFTRGPFKGDVARVIDRLASDFTWVYIVPRLSLDHVDPPNALRDCGTNNLRLEWGGERKLLPYALAVDTFGRSQIARTSDYFVLGEYRFTLNGFLIMEAFAQDFEGVICPSVKEASFFSWSRRREARHVLGLSDL